jgi:hypothetical protein
VIYAGRALFSLVLAAAGAFFAWATGKARQRRRRWLTDGVVIEGEVTNFKERSAPGAAGSTTMLAPVVSFRRADGQMGHFTSSEAARVSPYSLGQKVPVRYLASDPRQVELDVVARGYWAILAIGALAAACFLGALIPVLVTVIEWSR